MRPVTCTSTNILDVKENVCESPVLARIDEVSENENISTSSVLSSPIDSSVSLENAKEKSIPDVLRINISSSETNPEKEENRMSKLDSDLLECMSEFKLFSDGFVWKWF